MKKKTPDTEQSLFEQLSKRAMTYTKRFSVGIAFILVDFLVILGALILLPRILPLPLGIRILLYMISAGVGIYVGLLGQAIWHNAVHWLTRRGPPPVQRPPSFWIAFYSSVVITLFLGTVASLPPNILPVIVEKPILFSPGDGISMPQKTDITLFWNPSKDAVQYEVEVWGDPYPKMTPCTWIDATLCHIGQMAPGTFLWHVKARNDKGQASKWSDTWSFQIEMIPGYVELVDDLQLNTPAGNWPPNRGDKLIAYIHIRNGGDQPLQIVHLGVKGRRNGIELWDIGFWSKTLNGNEQWSFDANNERPLAPGEYSFQLAYSLDGSTWELLGSEYKFTIP